MKSPKTQWDTPLPRGGSAGDVLSVWVWNRSGGKNVRLPEKKRTTKHITGGGGLRMTYVVNYTKKQCPA